MRILKILGHVLLGFAFWSCKQDLAQENTSPGIVLDTIIIIHTDKACYMPGDQVNFSIDQHLPASSRIRYRQLGNVVNETAMRDNHWLWKAPAADFTGYMVDIYRPENGKEKIYGCVAVDVSSDWSRYPRYGFLSDYRLMGQAAMDSVIHNLSRLHINGLQFYDWEYEHHQPLAGAVDHPAQTWTDIASRTIYKSTVDYYLAAAHAHNMKAMSYNLCYGALSDAAADSVSDQWYMYTDQIHQHKKALLMGPPFKSNIYLTNPTNVNWQLYIAGKTKQMYEVYDFDGYHVDQVGYLGALYDYQGGKIDLPSGFGSFLRSMKNEAPDKRLVMNAVNQFGQQDHIASSPVDFLYSEVWSPNESYRDLAGIIASNALWSNGKKTVLAAYMDYHLADHNGYFNSPGVLLADAVIFAFGGSHLEMGEHMLCKEYFPNHNLQMKPDLQRALIHYYDFLTGYENLLRDRGVFNQPDIVSADGKIRINQWPPATGSVSVIGKVQGNRQIIHLINFSNASSLDWRDTNGDQPEPNRIQDIALFFSTPQKLTRLWMASPDINGGALQQIPFTQSGNSISFSLPSLQYWDMIVAEY